MEPRPPHARVLDFWLGPDADGWDVPADRMAFWFGRRADVDELIRRSFGPLIADAAAGRLDAWRQSPRGRLALLVLLDQMTRNAYRGTPQAFSHDALALSLCRAGLSRGDDRALRPIERAFFYLPLEHAEDLEAQQEAVNRFAALVDEAPAHAKEQFETFLLYALKHRAIIERFGRFPHRNPILGRESTEEESEFLSQPGSSF